MSRPEVRMLYNAGVGNLSIYVETRLEKAGAVMGAGSVTTLGWPVAGCPPEFLRVKVSPVGGPAMEAEFSREQIAACHKGVTSSEVSVKIDRLADAYAQARADAEGNRTFDA